LYTVQFGWLKFIYICGLFLIEIAPFLLLGWVG
jgi:hypothetical protein